MKKRITICIDEELLKDIDQIREYVSRSTFIDNVLTQTLNLQTADQFLRKTKERIRH